MGYENPDDPQMAADIDTSVSLLPSSISLIFCTPYTVRFRLIALNFAKGKSFTYDRVREIFLSFMIVWQNAFIQSSFETDIGSDGYFFRDVCSLCLQSKGGFLLT